MSTYFARFPKVDIDPLGNGNVVSYTDLFRFVDVNEANLDNFNNYLWYEITDGNRPDNVSYELYGTSDFYWTFFIVNDFLKNGYDEWPMSSIELENFVSEQYDPYSVLTILPTVRLANFDLNELDFVPIDLEQSGGSFDLMDDLDNLFGYSPQIFTGENTLNGLNLNYSGLRVRRLQSSSDQEAKIHEFESKKFQLWVKNVSDSNFFTTNTESKIKIFLTDEEESANLDWLIQTRDGWLKNLVDNYGLYQSVYDSIRNSTDYSTLKTAIENLLVFEFQNLYANARNAPYQFQDLNGEPICPLFCLLNEEGFPQTYYEREEEINFTKRNIRVIDPNIIRRFVSRFTQKLNSTSRLTA